MLTLLRKIRRSLIESSSFRKYMIYAIGEILLVMIGILLALQVNTWNESRKKKKTEVRLLQALHQTVVDDMDRVQFFIDGNDRVARSCRIILHALERDRPYHDSLALHFEQANQWWKILLATHAYENLKAHGLDFIKGDSTRINLSFLYEGQLGFAMTLDERQSLYYYNTVTPVLNKLFESIDHNWYVVEKGNVPYDYEALKGNKEYLSILRTNIGNRENYNEWIQFMMVIMRDLDRRLAKEVERY